MNRMILSTICLLIAVTGWSNQPEKPKAHKVGSYNIYVLTEVQGEGKAELLLNAPEEVIEKYIPGRTFPNAVHAVLIERNGEVWMVDTGFGRNIFEQMAEIGITPEEVDHVLLTHMHSDHIGGMMREGKPSFPNADVVVSEKEYDYWANESASHFIREYGDRVKVEQPRTTAGEFEDGISMIEAYGHTPGHVVFLVKDGENQFLIWGDLTHAMAVQMAHPEISVRYDVDPVKASESRANILKYVVEKDIPIAGMHVPFSGTGIVKKDKDSGGYIFIQEAE